MSDNKEDLHETFANQSSIQNKLPCVPQETNGSRAVCDSDTQNLPLFNQKGAYLERQIDI